MPDALVVTLVRGGAGGGSKEKDGKELGGREKWEFRVCCETVFS